MNLYISDLHFGHANVIRFDHRLFVDIEDLSFQELIRNNPEFQELEG